MGFFASFPGAFAVQAVLHSAVALFLAEAGIRLWDVRDAAGRFRYRLLVLVLPLAGYPAYQALAPRRGGFYFVQDLALFDASRWLALEPWGLVDLAALFGAALSAVCLATLVQEVAPILAGCFFARAAPGKPAGEAVAAAVRELALRLGVPAPEARVVEGEEPLAHLSGARAMSLVLTTALAEGPPERLRAALAHELAHAARRAPFTRSPAGRLGLVKGGVYNGGRHGASAIWASARLKASAHRRSPGRGGAIL